MARLAFVLSLLLVACGARTRGVTEPSGAEGLSLRLEIVQPASGALDPIVVRLVLVNRSSQQRSYLTSDSKNTIDLELVNEAGQAMPSRDLRSLPDFDVSAATPVERVLVPGAEVVVKEAAFVLPRKEVASTYDFSWRPFFYDGFPPGAYALTATWRSSVGFHGTLRSNTLRVVLPLQR